MQKPGFLYYSNPMQSIWVPRNYANGDCQILAAAIQHLTGWPVAHFEGAGDHITCITPTGDHVDIHGVRTADTIAGQWETDGYQRIGHIDNLGWLGCGWEARDLIAARQVLADAGLLTQHLAEIADSIIDNETDDDE